MKRQFGRGPTTPGFGDLRSPIISLTAYPSWDDPPRFAIIPRFPIARTWHLAQRTRHTRAGGAVFFFVLGRVGTSENLQENPQVTRCVSPAKSRDFP